MSVRAAEVDQVATLGRSEDALEALHPYARIASFSELVFAA